MPLSAELGIKGSPVGMVAEGPPDSPRGRRVESRPASGGRAYSETDGSGMFIAKLAGPLDRGRPAEAQAIDVLVQALRARGDKIELAPGSEDGRGEDGRLSINGTVIPVQVVSVPVDPSLWKELSKKGAAIRQGDGVALVREAFLHKKDKAIGTLLLLDAAQFGAIVGPALVKSYCRTHGNPEHEFSLREAWIVGPTVRSAIRLRLH